MGLFDTIIFPKPIPCAGCGAPHESTQTHELGNSLDTFRVGDVVAECRVVTGILEESLYCDACKRSDQKVYFTVWHSLLTGVHLDPGEAERRLLEVDRADILNHLLRHQKEERRLRRLLHSALSAFDGYAGYLKAADKEAFLKAPFHAIRFSGFEEYLKTPDPLTAIVERFRTEAGSENEDHGIFA